jgi:hypothetical protein
MINIPIFKVKPREYMIMNKRIIISCIIACAVFVLSFSGLESYLESNPITKDKLPMYPVSGDYRNYFFLQSIDDNTMILLGDFTGADRMLVLLSDMNSDNTIDKVVEYYIDQKIFKTPKKSKSQFYQDDIKALKEDIIEGKIFRDNYAYKMKSMEVLKARIKENNSIRRENSGYMVTYYDPDHSSMPMSEFYFAKKDGRYDLMFKTLYYFVFNSKIQPPLRFSVYCRNSKDPVVAAMVEELLKMVK